MTAPIEEEATSHTPCSSREFNPFCSVGMNRERTQNTTVSTHSNQASRAATRELIAPIPPLCSLGPALTTPLYRATLSSMNPACAPFFAPFMPSLPPPARSIQRLSPSSMLGTDTLKATGFPLPSSGGVIVAPTCAPLLLPWICAPLVEVPFTWPSSEGTLTT